MDGMHDLGGKQGFGPIKFEPGGPDFKHRWEARVNALYSLAVRKKIFNMDEYRHAIERMDSRHYLGASYFERTMTSVATLCIEKGVFSQASLDKAAAGAFPLSHPSAAGREAASLRPDFQVGDEVRVKNEYVSGHHRMPGYIRGKRGTIVGKSPEYPFPDAAAHGLPETHEVTYDVRFDTRELWSDAADKAHVHVGVFHSYLESLKD